MNTISILDTTLRDGEQAPGCTMQLKEKLEIAKALELLKIDIIEGGFAASSKGDFDAIMEIAKQINYATVASLARANFNDIDLAISALSPAKNKLLHIFLATSPIHMEYKLKLSETEVLDKIYNSVSYARDKIKNIQFSAEDATRSNLPFLAKAFAIAINAGASTINIADTVGISVPSDIEEMLKYLTANVKGIDNVKIGVHCHNDLGMAVANTLTAIKFGATHIEGTINGIGERAGNASIEEVAMALKLNGEKFGATTNIDAKRIYKTCNLVSNITGMHLPDNKPIVGKNMFKHESGIHQHGVLMSPLTYEIFKPEDIGTHKSTMVLGKHSGKHALKEQIIAMGINISADELTKCFERFKMLADKKKFVTSKDIEAIINNKLIDIENGYTLKSYIIQSHPGGAYADLILIKDKNYLTGTAGGLGGVDAGFTAINNIVGKNLNLLGYSLNAVTEGEDALGEAVVKLSDGEHTATGRGLSTDILEASLLAYIDGVNKFEK